MRRQAISMITKKIAFLTGKRGGMDAMRMTLASLDAAGHTVRVIATDQHLMDKFGYTLHEISQEVDWIIRLGDYSGAAESRMHAMGSLLESLPQTLKHFEPDILLLIGDRTESLIAAIVAHNMRICIAHVQGGDVTGGVDDAQRHAITKLSHIHFVSTISEKTRLGGMGEVRDRIIISGDPHIDRIVAGHIETEGRAREELGLRPDEPFVLVIHHSNTLHSQETRGEMESIMEAIKDVGIRPIYIYPSSDQGHDDIISMLPPKQSCYNLESSIFLALLKATKAIVGNSSAGIIEAPCFGTWTINVGDRQNGRMIGPSILNAVPKKTVIERFIRESLLNERQPPSKIYGEGNCHEIITKTLTEIEIDDIVMDKRMTY